MPRRDERQVADRIAGDDVFDPANESLHWLSLKSNLQPKPKFAAASHGSDPVKRTDGSAESSLAVWEIHALSPTA